MNTNREERKRELATIAKNNPDITITHYLEIDGVSEYHTSLKSAEHSAMHDLEWHHAKDAVVWELDSVTGDVKELENGVLYKDGKPPKTKKKVAEEVE